MALLESQARQAVLSPKKKRTISRAIAYQQRIKFNVNARFSRETSVPEDDFLQWVQTLIPQDKYEVFKALYRHPNKTTEVAGTIFDRLSRIFDGRNSVSNFQFQSSEERDDWEWYSQEVLNQPQVWKTRGWEFFKTEINSILVVDLLRTQETARPAPYFYWVPISDVIDYETVVTADGDDSRMSWIIFETSDNTYAVYDDESYRIFAKKDDKTLGEEIWKAPHDLGYCPARFFWGAPLDINEPDIKWHPLAKIFSDLDWYLFFCLSKRYLDLFGAYPIYSGYESSCDYNNEDGDECHGGFIKDRSGAYVMGANGLPTQCPICKNKRLRGAGSFVEIPVPNGSDQPDLRNPIQMLTADVSSLKYNVEEEIRIREMLITSAAGQSEEIVSSEAINELQVEATFESQSTILNRVKTGFEDAMNFANQTGCLLRYGNQFLSVNINLGTQFYTASAPSLRKAYSEAKASGASEAELDALQQQILETMYRNDPIQLQRMIILRDLEPYRHMSRSEVLGLNASQLIDYDDLQVKLNFSTFVDRFERENGNIIEFGSLVNYATKIDNISQTLKSYVKQRKNPEPNAGNV